MHPMNNPAAEPAFAAFESAALAEGFDTVLVRDWQPGQVVDEHSHPFDVKALVVRGDFWLSCGGADRHVKAGDRFELAAGQPHTERYGPEGATFWAARKHHGPVGG
jgi:AraC-like ligand binding domain